MNRRNDDHDMKSIFQSSLGYMTCFKTDMENFESILLSTWYLNVIKPISPPKNRYEWVQYSLNMFLIDLHHMCVCYLEMV